MAVSTAPTLSKVVINSIDVSSYLLTYDADDEYGKVIGSADIELSKKVSDVLTIDKLNGVGWTVTIQRGVTSATEKYIFRGEVQTIDVSGPTFKFSCVDRFYEAVRTEITETFDINNSPESGIISEIYKTIITEQTDLVADNTSVQNSGTVYTLKKFICNHADVFERASSLANALNQQHYYHADTDKVYLEPKGFVSGSEILTVGDNVVNTPTWTYSKRRMINELTLKGAEQQVQTTTYADGTAADAQTVTLKYQPISMKVYVGSGSFDPTGTGTKPSDNDANLKIGGKINSTSGTYDYEFDDDPNIKKVYFYDSSKEAQPSLTPASGTNNIEIQYTYKLPSPVIKNVPASITKYELHKTTHTRTDLKNVADAEIYVDKTLEYFAWPFISTTLKVVGEADLRVGRKYQCIDSEKGIDTELVVTKIKRSYPYVYDEITVGDEAFKVADWEIAIMDRQKRLEELEGESQDLLLHVSGLNREIEHKRRYMYAEKQDVTDSFVLGHVDFGVLGTDELGKNNTNEWNVIRLAQGNNTYKEYIYDTIFYDDGTDFNVNLFLNTKENPSSEVVTDLSSESNDAKWQINMAAYWPFNGNANDESVNSNDLTVNNTYATLTTDHIGTSNNAYSFDDTDNNDKMYLPSSSALFESGDMSISVWFKPQSTSTTTEWGGILDHYNWIIGYNIASTKLLISFRLDSGSFVSYQPTEDYLNKWTHVVVVYHPDSVGGNGYLKTYVNNVLKDTIDIGSNVIDTTYGTYNLEFGNSTHGGDHHFYGSISEPMIIQPLTEYTDSDVENLYNYTSIHKLINPQISYTDSNNVTINGYEFFSKIQTTGDDNNGTCLVLDADLDMPYQAHCFYFELKTPIGISSLQRIAVYANNAVAGRIDLDTYNNIIYFESVKNNDWNVNIDLSSVVDVNDGKVHKYLIEFNSDATRIYVDGSSALSTTANGDSTNTFFRYRYFGGFEYDTYNYGSGIQGIFAKPKLYNKILSSDERTDLFAGNNLTTFNTNWNTTTKTITVGQNGSCYTDNLTLGTKYNYFTVSIADVTGTYRLDITGDSGITWQQVTEDTRTAFTSSTTGSVKLRITNTGTSDIIIQNTYDIHNNYNEPAIKIILEE